MAIQLKYKKQQQKPSTFKPQSVMPTTDFTKSPLTQNILLYLLLNTWKVGTFISLISAQGHFCCPQPSFLMVNLAVSHTYMNMLFECERWVSKHPLILGQFWKYGRFTICHINWNTQASSGHLVGSLKEGEAQFQINHIMRSICYGFLPGEKSSIKTVVSDSRRKTVSGKSLAVASFSQCLSCF